MIYNPFAGGLRGGRIRRLSRAQRALENLGGSLKCYATDGPKTGGNIARRCMHEGSDLIVVAGGDGTINEVVDGMAGSAVPLAILPAGTANVLANEIGLSTNMETAAQQVPHCIPRRVSVGRMAISETGESRHFLLMAGVGLDAHIIFRLDSALKARLGKLAYWIYGFQEFGRSLEEFELTACGATHRCSFALITKVRNYGGDFRIARHVTLLDDEFEVVLFEGSNSWRYFIYLAGVAVGQPHRVAGVTMLRTSEVCVKGRPGERIHLQVDGEYTGLLPAKVGIVPHALTLLMPQDYGGKVN